ncbi:MurR/RpiR family transcriptional regulator [Microbacterium betulae]|uniref:MurR/RpiR family transcriptional regulator n=1 Tax=Microbacterium betulae TaxID=2981139 RepID=A0AA97I6E5_9MICO|nr:MurR/RpiR family transcriptional regulator [Microbacterium sp. AB]WOF22380.1 MurR/RpiR family transcriptional regulator [Microbacterium sp. AB]
MSTSATTAIHQRLSGLTPTEQRIARHVLDDPGRVVEASITQLAAESGTSPASVARFSQSLGFAGYPEFRLALATELDRNESDRERFQVAEGDVDRHDDAHTTVRKIAFAEASAIERTARQLDIDELERGVTAIRKARRIDIYGAASSGLAALDLEQKLHRAGLVAQARTDLHLALTGAALLDSRDVAVAISHSGRTLEIVQAAEVAAASGATTIAVTNNPRSPLARVCTLTLVTAVADSTFRSGAMASRIAQLAVLDFLFVRIAQADYDTISDNLKRTYDAVTSHRID